MLTPEREKDIRAKADNQHLFHGNEVKALLTEIDRLREMNSKLQRHFDHCDSDQIVTLKEKISLAMKALKWYGEHETNGKDNRIAREALKQIKGEK